MSDSIEALRQIRIQAIGIDTDGSLQIGYLRPAQDAKANGVLHMHTIFIPSGDDYDEEIQAVLDAAAYAVLDCLEDLPGLPVADIDVHPGRDGEKHAETKPEADPEIAAYLRARHRQDVPFAP